MSDRPKSQLQPVGSRLPATMQPRPSLPSLPTGNSLWPFERGRYERDTRTVAASAAYLRARADQAAAMTELVGKREELALAISRLHALPEMCAHQYEKGRLGRRNELRVLQLEHELSETTAKIALAAAQFQLSQYQPQPEPAAPAAALSPSLDIRDIEAVLQSFPDIKPEILRPILLALSAVLAEKKS